jgi:hypothetical protein
MRGMQTRQTGQKIIDALQINYNYLREHSTLKKTPAEKAGIRLGLQDNKIQNLIRLARERGHRIDK